jgi:hypothetical protein
MWLMVGEYNEFHLFPLKSRIKEIRMDRMVEWKRNKIRERHMIHLKWMGLFFVGLPIAVAVISKLWQLAIWSLLS